MQLLELFNGDNLGASLALFILASAVLAGGCCLRAAASIDPFL